MDSLGELKFKRLDQLKNNDMVAIKFNTQSFGNLREVTDDQAYLMGLLTGDGNLSHSSRVGLTSTDEEIVKFFKNYIKINYPEATISLGTDKITYIVNN